MEMKGIKKTLIEGRLAQVESHMASCPSRSHSRPATAEHWKHQERGSIERWVLGAQGRYAAGKLLRAHTEAELDKIKGIVSVEVSGARPSTRITARPSACSAAPPTVLRSRSRASCRPQVIGSRLTSARVRPEQSPELRAMRQAFYKKCDYVASFLPAGKREKLWRPMHSPHRT